MKKVLNFIINTFKSIDFKSKRTWVLFGLLVMIGFLSSLYGSYGYYLNSGTKNVVISGTASFGGADITLQIYTQDRDSSGAAIANSYSRVYYIPQVNYSYESAKTVCGTGITLSYDSTEYEFTINSTQKGICKVYFAAEGTVVPNATFGLNVEQTLNGENYKQMGSLPDNDYVYSINSTRTSCTDPNATLTIEDRRIKVMSTRDLDCNIYVDIESYTGGALVVFTSEDFSYTGAVQSFTVPATGYYKLEVWGAQGGQGRYDYGSANPGNGGYSTGIVQLVKNTNLYIYVGGSGSIGRNGTGAAIAGGYNGGGNSGYNGSSNNNNGGGSGGGGTDIRVGIDSLYARIIVAGGGGGGGNSWSNISATGGAGGGTSGVNGTSGGDASASACANTWGSAGAGGSQTSGGCAGSHQGYTGTAGTFGQGGSGYTGNNNSAGGGGGGGWYGGGPGSQGYSAGSGAGGGGSGYVYNSSTASNYPSGCLLDSSHYMTSASTVAGNTSFTSPTGTSETGHTGNGYARITWVGKTLS